MEIMCITVYVYDYRRIIIQYNNVHQPQHTSSWIGYLILHDTLLQLSDIILSYNSVG